MSVAVTAPEMVVSSLPEAEEPWATGASLTGVTVRVTAATFESKAPSLALYVKVTVPLKLDGPAKE